jgi:hypothetical protein
MPITQIIESIKTSPGLGLRGVTSDDSINTLNQQSNPSVKMGYNTKERNSGEQHIVNNTETIQGVYVPPFEDAPVLRNQDHPLGSGIIHDLDRSNAPTLRAIEGQKDLDESCQKCSQDWPGSLLNISEPKYSSGNLLGNKQFPKYNRENQLGKKKQGTVNITMTTLPKYSIPQDCCLNDCIQQPTAKIGQELATGKIFEVPGKVPMTGSTPDHVQGPVEATEGYSDHTWILVKRKK